MAGFDYDGVREPGSVDRHFISQPEALWAERADALSDLFRVPVSFCFAVVTTGILLRS